MFKVIHITAHLGGGVGKALSTLILNDKKNIHKVICLEKPKIKKFYNKIKLKTRITQSIKKILEEVKKNDIIQIEYWPHPLLIKILLNLKIYDKRILFWCHFSGLGNPKFHKKLVNSDIKLILTSDISKEIIKKNFSVISSASVLENKRKAYKKKKNFFYIGSLHNNKIHPNYIEIILRNINEIQRFHIYGENELINNFKKKIRYSPHRKKISFSGFQNNVQKIFIRYNFLLYLLKKNHYGSAENILIEAMGMGVIPIVLKNKVEKKLIRNGYNGFVLNDINQLNKLLKKIKNKKISLTRISKNCRIFAHKNFNPQKMTSSFNIQYNKLRIKSVIDFRNYFSENIEKFFLSIIGSKNSKNLLSYNKSGLNHFLKHFRKNQKLIRLKQKLK